MSALSELAQRQELVVLGIDPGTYAMGFGVVGRRSGSLIEVDHGVFKPRRDLGVPQRLHFMSEKLGAALDHHRPDVVSLEEAFFLKNAQSALRLGEARATVLLACTARDIPVVQYPPARVKKSITGHGGASKDLVCLLYTSPSPRDKRQSRMPSSA